MLHHQHPHVPGARHHLVHSVRRLRRVRRVKVHVSRDGRDGGRVQVVRNHAPDVVELPRVPDGAEARGGHALEDADGFERRLLPGRFVVPPRLGLSVFFVARFFLVVVPRLGLVVLGPKHVLDLLRRHQVREDLAVPRGDAHVALEAPVLRRALGLRVLLGANLLELSHDAEREVAVHHLRLVVEDVVLPLQDARLALLKDGEPLGGVQRLLVRRERHERARVGDESGRDSSHAVVHRGAAAADVRCVR